MSAQFGSHTFANDDDLEEVVSAGPGVEVVPGSIIGSLPNFVVDEGAFVTDRLVVGLASGSGSGSGVFAACALIEYRTNAPDSVSSLKCQPPLLLAPGTSAAHFSSLSPTAQFASDMLLSRRKSSHLCVSIRSSAPFPSALHAPHSVANNAMPFANATAAFDRSDERCVFA